ncbi:hypothetical protein GLOIN_2v1874800 [Rhizophagus irregularis DAOM 181602=DAOM 197198]|uniref:Uncharacterized protein n=1 Tax=Rhizophagus irregularis (strain DAOM 181602 / DAOM 197198 / MUCL 43194) TaxID=747089 RepID=A0A2P4Q5N8_RHIID|nr:hypothetical protein GLOIN_2v1874800 [Rhizophagus irregularis DAOM 181602=DAOM 197198]POG72971.1 hypothetical protein GLOIN_2v1874800 [Rhizophagus irregularis DAOM 181602=DAOM 197198]|eukprot:XP_025179837.1 hypothetical protein GLOIN_2v1874800 [Rhizophagus irregularis DAOM 181602=DAOM 197198]
MQSELYVIKLLTDNDEIKAENAKVKAENAKLRQAMEKNEARLAKLEQSDKEKATFGLKYIGENMAFNCVKETTPGTGLWAKGNAGRNYKSTTETMLKVKSQSLEETKFIHAFRCGITGTTGMNSFSRFSSRFLDDSRQFLRFLDDSWTIRNFWMILERGFLDRKRRRDEILEVVCWN